MRMLRLDNVLVQKENNGNNLSFIFRSKRWSMYTFVIAILLIVGATIIDEVDNVRF